MKNFLAVVVFCLPAFGQMASSGLGVDSGSVQVAGIPGGGPGPLGFADLPVNWVDNTACNPTGGTYDTEVVLGTTNNIGPNDTGEAIGQPYALTPAGLLDAMNNWRDNADNASQTPHFADKWWRIKIPAGTVLHCTTYNANGACISLPGKMNGAAQPTKCLVVDSTTPLPDGQIACSHGLPGFGGARNPGCTTDKASMWKLQMEGNVAAHEGIEASTDLVTPTNLANHVLIADAEITMLGGVSQSGGFGGAPVDSLFSIPQNPLHTRPPTPLQVANVIGIVKSYLHGNDPGDAGQPTTGSSVDASGNCLAWYNSGTVNTANTDGTHGSVTLPSFTRTLTFGNAAFGPTFTVGSTINIGGTMSGAGGSITGGTNYTISAFDPTASNTVLTVNGQPGTQTGVHYLQINPPPQYTPGCGDDMERGIALNGDNSWAEYNYIEKEHWQLSEGEAMTYGFDNGPTKIVHNWMEGSSNALFSGGAPSDSAGGPGSDNEIRGNFLGIDLNYRFLTGNASNSPNPPFGCGPFDGVANHSTCPFSWDIKNRLEAKLGHRNLFDGNIIDGNWSDGQSGFIILFNVEATSGGQAAGVFDPVTGLPASYIDNVRFSNNWVRNSPQLIQWTGRGDMSPSNSGGIALPTNNFDVINNLFSNISDANQFGNPGHIWQYGASVSPWTCAMSHVGTQVTAACAPFQTNLKNPAHVSSISVDGSHNVTILHGGIRLDPTLCTPGSEAACIAAGQTIVINGVSGLTSGSFAMSGTSGNYLSDGTGGNTIVYNDGTSAAGTVCNSVATCTTAIGSGTLTFASLAGKMINIAVGDGVYAFDTGDGTCAAQGYLTGSTAANYAVAGTVATGLTVVYNLASVPTGNTAFCRVSNAAGVPRNVTVQNNTFLANNVFSIDIFNQWHQPINNYFHDNVFADNDAGTNSDVHGDSPAGEGTVAFQSWDPASFQYYHNVMQGRASANWSVMNCPGGACANAFPSTVNCSSSTADATCLGYAGFMGSSPTITYPSGACSNANAPFNCPLMALPWANNLTLSNLNYVGSSSYSTQGVNPGQLTNAMTQSQYVCPAGANCGAHGPYPDSPHSASLSWSWSGTGTPSYSVYRGTTSGGETSHATGISSTSYVDTAVTSGVTYYYEVTAVVSSVESAKSNEGTAVIP
jgi:hypothetical protein